MSAATYALEVMWDGVSWTDETSRIVRFTSKMGRDSELNDIIPGRLTLVMRNGDGRYSRDYATSPIYPNVKAFKRVRLRGTFLAVTYSIFYGYVKVILPNVPGRTCTIECVDALYQMGALNLNLALATDKLSSDRVTAIIALATAAGLTFPTSAISTGQQTFPFPYWRNTPIAVGLQECADNELGGLFYIGPDGGSVFQDRHYRARQALAATFTNNLTIDREERDDSVYSKVILQAMGYSVGTAGVIWSYYPLPFSLAPGESYTFEINYATLSAATSPTTVTDWAADRNGDGTGSDLTSQIASSGFVDYGGGASWTLTNNSLYTALFTRIQLRGTPYVTPTDLRQVQRTAASSDSPFPRAYTRAFRLHSTPATLKDFADYLVTHVNTAQPLAVAKVEAVGNAALTADQMMTQMLARTISDRVRITDNLIPAATQFSADDFFIESVQQDYTQESARLITTWRLTQWLADQFWILDTSALDTDTILAF